LILRPGLERPGSGAPNDSSFKHFCQSVQEEMSANIGCELRRKNQREIKRKKLEREKDKPEDGPGRERTKAKTKTINKQSTLKNNFNTVKDDESHEISRETQEKERTRQRKRGIETRDSIKRDS
jgi:hypothetical protein